jgi:tetratricopeptide (TPR) repeat protein
MSFKKVAAGAWLALAAGGAAQASTHQTPASAVAIVIRTGTPGCAVELDAAFQGKTNAQGNFTLAGVDPTDHYIHVRCPDQAERGYWVSPEAGQRIELRAEPRPAAAAPSGIEAAQAKIELRKLVLKAVQERAAGQFEQAVRDLHEAAGMDPENSDLHRELGITFLLAKDWKRARVEMIEALKHDPTDADAHNGLGYALDKLGDIQAALAEYRAATRLDPDNPSYAEHYMQAMVELAARQSAKKK